MGKASRVKERGVRQKVAAQREAARRAEQRRRVLISGGAIVAVIAVVVSLILVKTLGSPAAAAAGSPDGTALPPAVARQVSTVPGATLSAVGAGTANPASVLTATGPKLTSGGRPEILYVGAEYCPYCATERWPLAVALSRFGTFSGLHGIRSSSTDVFPSQPTLTFFKARYASKYLTFVPVETTAQSASTPLQHLTAAEQAVLSRYDAPPYVPASSAGAIPFLDIGNRFLVSGAQYDPQVLQGMTWAQVAAALQDPSSAIGRGADGAANLITAAICKVTGNQPGSVCMAAGVRHPGAQP